MFTACCEWLSRMLGTAGEQGWGVIAVYDGAIGVRRFVLQSRALTHEQAGTLRRLAAQGTLEDLYRSGGSAWGIAIAADLPIQFCPYCGTNLATRIEKQRDAFDALATEHRQWREGE
jgi:hypothetical protein